jgi:hypothetical protein
LAEAAGLSESMAARFRRFAPTVDAAAERFGIAPELVAAVAFTESRFSPGAESSKGARGIMQIMPATWETLAGRWGLDDIDDPRQNITAGAGYLAALARRWEGRPVDWTLASYFAGAGNVKKYGPGRYDHYTRAVLTNRDAIEATRRRCETFGGGSVPRWSWQRSGSGSSPERRPRPSRPRPTLPASPPPSGGGDLAALVVLAVVAGLAFGGDW